MILGDWRAGSSLVLGGGVETFEDHLIRPAIGDLSFGRGADGPRQQWNSEDVPYHEGR